MAYELKKLIKLLKNKKWELLKSKGKGSHQLWRKDGWPPVTLPTSRSELRKGTYLAIQKIILERRNNGKV